eukprot:1441115-Rhodomonas_salina.3
MKVLSCCRSARPTCSVVKKVRFSGRYVSLLELTESFLSFRTAESSSGMCWILQSSTHERQRQARVCRDVQNECTQHGAQSAMPIRPSRTKCRGADPQVMPECKVGEVGQRGYLGPKLSNLVLGELGQDQVR